VASEMQKLVTEKSREYENSIYDGADGCGVHGDFRTAKQNLAATLRALVQVDSFHSVMANSRPLLLSPMHANLSRTMDVTNAVQAMHSYSHVLALRRV